MRKGTMRWQSDRLYHSQADYYANANMPGMGQRDDLTRELHDTVIQPLTSLLVSFTQIECQLSGADLVEAHLGMWKRLAQEALDSLRSSLAGVHATSYRIDDLPGSLRSTLVPQFSARGLRLNLEIHDWPVDLPPLWNTHLYLAVREALTNVEKHAHASEASILLRADPDGLTITITDDGVGFPQTDLATERHRPGFGLGLDSIRDRVTLLGGQMDLSSTPGRGVQIEIQLPRPLPVKRLAPCTPEFEGAKQLIDQYVH